MQITENKIVEWSIMAPFLYYVKMNGLYAKEKCNKNNKRKLQQKKVTTV